MLQRASKISGTGRKKLPLKVVAFFWIIVFFSLAGSQDSEAETYRKSYEKMCPIIALDAGHGGADPGSISSVDGVTREADINRMFAQKIAWRLQKAGFYVINVTAPTKKVGKKHLHASLRKRAWLSNVNKADFFISIHANSNKNPRISGAEIYYYPRGKKSMKVAKYIAWSLKKRKIRARTVKNNKLYLLRNTDAPAVLVEVGFLSNRRELKRLKTPSYQQVFAEGVVDAMKRLAPTKGCNIAKNRSRKAYTL